MHTTHTQPAAGALLDSLFAASPWPMLLLNADGSILATSQRTGELLGCEYPTLYGTQFEQLVPAEEGLHLRSALAHVVKQAAPVLARAHLRHSDGCLFDADFEVLPVPHDAQQRVTVLIYPRSFDVRHQQLPLELNRITPALLAASSAEAAFEHVAAIFDQLGMHYLVVRRAGDQVIAPSTLLQNTLFEHLLLANLRAVLFDQPLRYVPPGVQRALDQQAVGFYNDLAPTLFQMLPHALATPVMNAANLLALRGYIAAPLLNGTTTIGALVVWGPALSPADVPSIEAFSYHIGATLAQIELRARMETQIQRLNQLHRELQQSEQRYRRLVEQAEATRTYLDTLIHTTPDVLLSIRDDMTIRLLNPEHITSITGYAPATVDGQPAQRFLARHMRRKLLPIWRAVRAGVAQTFEVALADAQGAPLIALVSAAAVPAYREVFVIVKDVTSQRGLEAQLRQNEKLAALGGLVAGAAHELNNPLAIILGLAQLQLLEDLPAASRNDIEGIERAAVRASSIVQQLRMFARPQPAQPQLVDLALLAQETVGRLSEQLSQGHVEVLCQFPAGELYADGDPLQLGQVLFNIVHNAFQSVITNPRHRARRIVLRGNLAEALVHVSISDSGPGIAPADLSRIFEPFFTTREVGEGLGLGLAIVYTIMQQHHGRVWVESIRGSRTTFHLELPLASVLRQAVPEAGAWRATVVPAGVRVLLVEDEAAIRAVVQRSLVQLGYQVEAVASAEVALEHALHRPYALIISDLQMPRMDGAALYQKLQPLRPALRWLIITGDTMGERSRAFLEQTALPVLPKPFTREQLAERVAACLELAMSVGAG